MARTVACYKWIAAEDDLHVDPTTHAVDPSLARRKISDYDRNTIEAARLAAGQIGGELIALTFGEPDAKSSAKEVLARGADRVVHVVATEGSRADGYVTANVLTAGITRIGDVGLVLCTEGASDTYAHEVGARVGELLGWPVVTHARELTIDGARLRAVRVVGEETETVECALPAVVTVVPEIATAPIPGLKSVIAAGRKPVEQIPVADLGLSDHALAPRTTVTALRGYVAERRRVLLDEGDDGDKVAALVSGLAEAGALR